MWLEDRERCDPWYEGWNQESEIQSSPQGQLEPLPAPPWSIPTGSWHQEWQLSNTPMNELQEKATNIF